MKGRFLKSIGILMLVLVLGLYLAPMLKIEGFKTRDAGKYPLSVEKPILNNFPLIGKNVTSDNNYSDIWFHYPIFTFGSFKQITNNLRFNDNPDNGQCIRADFCGALYHDKKVPSNEVFPLPEAEEGDGARVGYFRSEPNKLFFSIPTNQNILY